MQFCKQCNQQFGTNIEEGSFFKKFSIPLPNLCPNCRQRRRLAFRNTRNLYKRNCDRCKQSTLSIYSDDKKMTVYCQACYRNNDWDPLRYSADFDFSKTFFEQFDTLLRKVPVPAQIMLYPNTLENSQFNNEITRTKNSYMLFDGEQAEDSLYGETFFKINNCMDFYRLVNCELCYECIGCERCYNLKYSQWCFGCIDSWFLVDCQGSRNCFGSINLINQEYYIYNKFVGERRYKEFIQKLDLIHPQTWQEVQNEILRLCSQQPRRAVRGHHNENVSGDNLYYCSDTFNSFDCAELKNCRYCTELPLGAKDSQDLDIWGGKTELCYNGSVGHDVRNIVVGFYIYDKCFDVQYSLYCRKGSHDLFGCISLEKQSHCILNRQYTPSEYLYLQEKIINYMKKTGEYGEYWPVQYSPFAYNESKAMDYFPLSKQQVMQCGWHWHNVILPTATSDSSICIGCMKPFRLVEPEKEFYQKHKLPNPQKCFECRHQARLQKRNLRQLFQRLCAKCKKDILSTYHKDQAEIVYCESCYRKAIY